MALVRAVPIANFLDTALSTSQSVGYSTAPPGAGESLYTAMHLTAVSTGRTFVATVQSASSSGFSPLTTEITFALTSEIGSTWQTLASPSTDRPWRRLNVTLSTASSTAGTWNGLVWVGFRS